MDTYITLYTVQETRFTPQAGSSVRGIRLTYQECSDEYVTHLLVGSGADAHLCSGHYLPTLESGRVDFAKRVTSETSNS